MGAGLETRSLKFLVSSFKLKIVVKNQKHKTQNKKHGKEDEKSLT
jgi:hypothetical protein